MDAGQFAARGFALVPQLVDAVECETIAGHLAAMPTHTAGTRCLLSQVWCLALADKIRHHLLLPGLVPGGFVAVQCTYFEKSAQRNWLVPVHQDLSIPVAERIEHASLGAWSEKEGGIYVQPAVEFLEQLVAVRLHIDDCGAGDGPLRVVPGSHLLGKIGPEAALAARECLAEVTCTAGAGDALAMRPLLLHASSKSTGSSRRRVLHFLFGPNVLPAGLQWPDAVRA